MSETWRSTDDDYPDWPDGGRAVEVVMSDGREISGTLDIYEMFFTGEDEVPLIQVVDSSGNGHAFGDVDRFRFTSPASR